MTLVEVGVVCSWKCRTSTGIGGDGLGIPVRGCDGGRGAEGMRGTAGLATVWWESTREVGNPDH